MSQTIGAVFELRDNFTAKAREISGATRTLQSNINGATNSIKSFGSGSNIASRGLDSLKSKVLGLAGTYLSLQGIHKLADSAIGESSGLEQYRNTLNIVMKDSKKAGEMMSWATDFANKTPFETGEVVEATVKLQSYGITAKDVMSNVGDMASVMNKPLDQAVEAVADAQTGEVERLKEFGITKQMIIDQGAKTMAGKELVNSKGQIVDQKNFNKAMFALMEERYKGGMDIQSKTLKGTWSTVTGVAKSALAQLMGVASDGTIKAGGLFDKLKTKVTGFADTLQKWSTDGTITKAAKTVEDGFKLAGNAVGWVKDNLNWLIPVCAGAVGAITAFKVINTVKEAIDLWKGSVFAITLAQEGLNVVLSMNPIGLVIIAIGLLVAAGVALYMNWDTAKVHLHDAWVEIKNSFLQGANDCIGHVNNLINTINNLHIPSIHINTIETYKLDTTGSIGSKAAERAGINGSHANGLNRVPFDGYVGELHRDEMVLTKNQAENYRKSNNSNGTEPVKTPSNSNNKNTKKIGDIYVTIQGNVIGNKQFADEVGEHIYSKVELALNNM